MAGSLWHAGQQSFADAIKAVLPVIPIPFLSFLPIEWMLAWLGASFWLVLIFEKASVNWQSYHKDYQKMRFVLTSVVFVCHILIIGMSIYPE
jgi:cytochrome bd-type quinol oxidase subunit 2